MVKKFTKNEIEKIRHLRAEFPVSISVKTYLDIPAPYFSYMPTYLPPVKVAHDLDVFPASKESQEIKMLLSYRERVRN